mgnify:FL=1
MKRTIAFGALLAGAVVTPQAASAGGFHYTHKAGVPQAEWDADQKVCVDAAKEARKNPGVPNVYNPTPQSTAAAAGSAFATGFMRGMMRRKAINATYYGCLKAHGYVERELSKDEFKAVRTLKGDALKAKVYEMATAQNPPHPIIPEDDYD